MKDYRVGCPILDYLLSKEYAVGLPIFAYPSVRRTPTCLFLSLWTTSSSMKTNCVVDRCNSEFWQRIGQPYVCKLGRCFVAVVEIEADRCAVCLAELDAVQSEADRQADVRCPTPFWSGRRAGNKQSPDILSLPICVRRFRLTWMFHTKHFENCMETLVYGRINQIREYER